MAAGMVVRDTSSDKNVNFLDNTKASKIPGLPEELLTVLSSLPVQKLKPSWSIRQSNGGFSVLVIWKPNSNFPAKNRRGKKKPATKGVTTGEKLEPSSSPKTSVCHKKKNKSPSARKRSLKRLLEWRSKRKGQSPSGSQEPQCDPHTQSLPVTGSEELSTQPTRNGEDPPVEAENHADSVGIHVPDCKPPDPTFSDRDPKPETESDSKPPDPNLEAESKFFTKEDPEYLAYLLKRKEIGTDLEITMAHLLCAHNQLHLSSCFNCHASEDIPNSHKLCTRCKFAKYCSKDCQRIHWKTAHKHMCQSYGQELAAAENHIVWCQALSRNLQDKLFQLDTQNSAYAELWDAPSV